MVTFDNGRHSATVRPAPATSAADLKLDLRAIGNEPLLSGSRIGELGEKRLKALIEYVDHGFRPDPASSLTWREQFCRALAGAGDSHLLRRTELTPGQLKEVRAAVRDINLSLAMAARAVDPASAFRSAVTYQYHDGFNHLTRDDDFIAVRSGDRIVAIIALPGNDYNELKKFLKAGGDRVLSPENVQAFRRALAAAKKAEMAKMLRRTALPRPSGGFKIGREDS